MIKEQFTKSKFRWAYVPLAIGGFYSAISLLGIGVAAFQSLIINTAQTGEGMQSFSDVNDFIRRYWGILLGFGVLSAALGLAMLMNWRTAIWILAGIVGIGLCVFTPFYAAGARTYLAQFFSSLDLSGYPAYLQRYFRAFEAAMRPGAILISIVFLALPGIAQLVVVIVDRRTLPQQVKPNAD